MGSEEKALPLSENDKTAASPDEILPQDELNIPPELPVLPVVDIVVFPQMVTALNVSTEKELKLLDYTLTGKRLLALALQRKAEDEKKGPEKDVRPEDLYEYATAVVVLQMLRMPDNSAKMLVQGISRLKIEKYVQEEPYLVAEVKPLEEKLEEGMEMNALSRSASDQFMKMISMTSNLPEELKVAVVPPYLRADRAPHAALPELVGEAPGHRRVYAQPVIAPEYAVLVEGVPAALEPGVRQVVRRERCPPLLEHFEPHDLKVEVIVRGHTLGEHLIWADLDPALVSLEARPDGASH